MPGGTPNNRVTTAEFYQALLKQNDRMDNMERRIITRLDNISDLVSRQDERIKSNTDEIEILRKGSNAKDWAVGIVAVVAAAISAVLGTRQ